MISAYTTVESLKDELAERDREIVCLTKRKDEYKARLSELQLDFARLQERVKFLEAQKSECTRDCTFRTRAKE
jgi:chromosome segregation ATPase